MPTRLAIRIQESLDAFTPSERTLASYILENQHLVVGLSAAELAREAGTSKSTTVRFFRSLGYESFDAVRLQARDELNRLQPGAELTTNIAITRSGTPEAFLADEMTAIARTHEGLNSETAKKMVERLAVAERIWIGAFGEDAPLAPLAYSQLASVRSNVNLLSDGVTAIFPKLASMGPRDVLFAITLGDRNSETRFAMEQAKAAGSGLLVVTGLAMASPIGSDVVIRCHAHSSMPNGSITAAVSVIHLIARQLGLRLGDRSTARRAMIEGVKEGSRDRN